MVTPEHEGARMSDSQEKRLITLEDLSSIALVSDPQAQPGGTLIAWVVTRMDDDQDTYKSAIWVAENDGGNARQLTSGTHREATPRWPRDGQSITSGSNRTAVP